MCICIYETTALQAGFIVTYCWRTAIRQRRAFSVVGPAIHTTLRQIPIVSFFTAVESVLFDRVWAGTAPQ